MSIQVALHHRTEYQLPLHQQPIPPAAAPPAAAPPACRSPSCRSTRHALPFRMQRGQRLKWKMNSLNTLCVKGCLLIILLCGLMTIRCPIATSMLGCLIEVLCSWWGAKQCNYPVPEVPSLSSLQSRLHCKLLKDLHLCLPREEVVLPLPLVVLLVHVFLQVL